MDGVVNLSTSCNWTRNYEKKRMNVVLSSLSLTGFNDEKDFGANSGVNFLFQNKSLLENVSVNYDSTIYLS